jgi:putative ABC transport system substrate-binding protein
MKRREFITLFGGATAAWPLAARAQQPAMPMIGYLNPSSSGSNPENVEAFLRGLAEAGYVEGRNVTTEYRWGDGHYEQLPALAADLVARRVSVIVAGGSSAPALAAKTATTTIQIVFQTGADPVRDGLVTSMNRPGGNVTGISRLCRKRTSLVFLSIPAARALNPKFNSSGPRHEPSG